MVPDESLPDPVPVTALPPPSGQVPVWPDPPAPAPEPVAAGGRRWWPRALFWGGITVMAVAALFGLVDWGARTYEMTRLLDRVEASEAAMTRYQDEVRAVTLPDSPSQADRDRAEEELTTAAAEGSVEVKSAGDEVARLSFLPWHDSLVEAQGAYLAHNRAWVDHLRQGSADVAVLLGQDPLIDSTWASAEVRMRSAEPWPTWPMVGQRVDTIFAPAPTPDDSDGGLAT